MICFGRKDPIVIVESAKIVVVSMDRANYFKNLLNQHINKIPEGKTTLVHMLFNSEMCDIYIDNIGNKDVLYENLANSRHEWIKKSCWSWNHVYSGKIKLVENVIFLENGEILLISTFD